MPRAINSKGRRRARVVVLTIALILLLVALLSDLGQGARDWVADLWNTFGAETVSAPSDATDVADAAAGGGDGSAPTRPLSSLPTNADGALALAAYRGQAAGAGQAKRAAGVVGSVDGGPAGAAAGVAAGAGEQPAAEGGVGPAQGQDVTASALALADTGSGGGAGGGGGAAASGGDGFGGSGPFSTVPGGPFVNLTDGEGNGLPHDGPNDNPSSSVPEPGTLFLLGSAVVALGARRWWRG